MKAYLKDTALIKTNNEKLGNFAKHLTQNGFKHSGKFRTAFDQYTKQCNIMKEKIILIGGGGHCKAYIDAIEKEGRFAIVGIADAYE